jgi:hypothetical protein
MTRSIAFVIKLWSTRTSEPTRASLSHYENMRHSTLLKVQALRDLSKFFHCLRFPLHVTAWRRLDVDSLSLLQKRPNREPPECL